MAISVDPSKVYGLSEEIKRLSRVIETNESGLNREITLFIQEVNSSYSEYYVHQNTSDMERLLGEIRILAQSMTEKLNAKNVALQKAAQQYRQVESDAQEKINKSNLFYFTKSLMWPIVGGLVKVTKKVVATLGDVLSAILGKAQNAKYEPSLNIPLNIKPLKADLKINPKVYSEEVKKLQQKLKYLGYDIKVDGYFGKETLARVNEYKSKYGIANTGTDNGVVNDQTWLYLFGDLSGQLKLSPGEYSEYIRIAQIRLKDLGYPVEVTGKYDVKTENAVNQFKNNNKLGNTGKWEGVLGPQTWGVLFGGLSVKFTKPQVKPVTTNSSNDTVGKASVINQEVFKDSKLYRRDVDLLAKINSINRKKFGAELDSFKKIYEKNKKIYDEISKKTGLPPELIAAIHYRESGCNFNTYLHNGDPLGKPTTHVPKGKNFDNFVDAAVDALLGKSYYIEKYKLTSDSTDITAMMAFSEVYNGLGYYNNNRVSPYIYSGTNMYVSGKYVKDGVYSATAVDAQPGVYILVNALSVPQIKPESSDTSNITKPSKPKDSTPKAEDVKTNNSDGEVKYNKKGNVTNTDFSTPVVPKVTNSPGSRGDDAYNKVLDQFDVKTNSRYTPRSGWTFCNVYVWDVLNAMGVPLPKYMVADGIKNYMNSTEGKDDGWVYVSAEEAQKMANQGYPTIAVNSGHAAIIAPSPNPDDGKVYVSQAGGSRWITRCSPINSVWSKNAAKQYYYHK